MIDKISQTAVAQLDLAPSGSARPDLPADYYLKNFQQLVDFVSQAYADLLTADEQAFATGFSALSASARMLYVRLLCRSHNVFRLDKLHYSEISDLKGAVAELASAGFVVLDARLPVTWASRLFTKPELLVHIQAHPDWQPGNVVVKKLKRDELEELWQTLHARPVYKAADTFADDIEPEIHESPASWLSAADESRLPLIDIASLATTILLNRSEHFDVFRLCFFGNLYQDMTDFVLRDLGLMCYEHYEIDQCNRAFGSRSQLDAHLEYFRLAESLPALKELTAEEILNVESLLPKATDNHLLRRLERLRISMARQLERMDKPKLADSLYQKCARAPASERRIRILMKREAWPHAFELCQQVLDSPTNDEEAQTVSGLAARIARKCDVSYNDSWAYKPPQEFIELADTGETVELQAAEHYSGSGTCFYTENVLIDGVFGLAFWDVIFAPVSGAFFNPFQAAPSDFHDPEFLHARRDLLTQQFQRLAVDGELKQQVTDRFSLKQGIVNPMVNWRYLAPDLLDLAIERIPLQDWLAMFKRLLLDTRSNRSGLPDLVVFPKDVSESGYHYRLVEVKGPGDTLQKNQIRWMRFFADHNIDHAVCHVSWCDADSSSHG